MNKETTYSTPEEKFQAIGNLRDTLENDFISLGQLLSEIKRTKLYTFKGYDKFKEFIESEYTMSSSLVGKLIRSYELYVTEMDIDEETLKGIGFDRLQMIAPMMKKADWQTRDEWIKKAEEMTTKDLRDHIKEIKAKDKEENTDLKDVYVDQYLDRMLSYLNCSKKELNFKLALYFQDADLDGVKKIIKKRQQAFELEVANPHAQTEVPGV